MVNLIAILAIVLIGPFVVLAVLLDSGTLPMIGFGLFIIAMPFVGRGYFLPLHLGMGLFLIGMATYFHFF